ncbi:alpha/beta-hydrolase [Hesseltinella vesiculosa]|uniref:Alpha/beta-hydrolase n=1 Tax=Hesseltinella vesiculosa TaxID=101127 RepID=A0A1X2GUC0_9FUNG|nr:alpha/beta-hydrolase [Hesseltinella vesiculosa]
MDSVPSVTQRHQEHGSLIVSYLYELDCQKEAPLIVLFHGAGGDQHLFQGLISPLTKAGYRLLLSDFPGHGQSQMTTATHESDLDFTRLAHLSHLMVTTYLGQRPTSQVILGGVSMGGILAQCLARQHDRSFPISAVLCVGCPCLDITEPQLDWIPFYQTASLDEALPFLAVARQSIVDSVYLPEAKVQAKLALDNVSDPTLFASFKAIATVSADSFGPYPRNLPLLLLRGEHDVHADPIMQAWDALHPADQNAYQIIPLAGHLTTLDAPALVAHALLHFLRQ